MDVIALASMMSVPATSYGCNDVTICPAPLARPIDSVFYFGYGTDPIVDEVYDEINDVVRNRLKRRIRPVRPQKAFGLDHFPVGTPMRWRCDLRD